MAAPGFVHHLNSPKNLLPNPKKKIIVMKTMTIMTSMMMLEIRRMTSSTNLERLSTERIRRQKNMFQKNLRACHQ